MANIFWAGDSTVQTNYIMTYPQTGLGQVFSLYVKESVEIYNYAKNGRSTKNFLDEGRLELIRERITKDDFLFIQFAHNDEKKEDPSRYTEPFSTYMDNLKIFTDMAKSRGALPVLITPLERWCFVDGKYLGIGEHSDYVAAMKQTAEQQKVPLIDAYSYSRAELKKAGPEKSKKWFMNLEPGVYASYPDGKTDNTHLRYEGAVMFAGLIAKGLGELGGVYKELLIEL